MRPRTRPVRESGSNAQKGVSSGDGRQHFGRSIPILNVGPVHDKTCQQSNRIGDDVALAPLDPFSVRAAYAAPLGPRSALIIAGNPATFSGFYALAVNHTRCRAGRTPAAQTRQLDQRLVDFAQHAVAAPVIKIASHCRDGREVIGQPPPLAPGRRDGEDRVRHIPQIHRPRSANPTPRRKQRRKQRPFPVARVTCVSAPAALMLRTGEFSPSHCGLRSVLQPNRTTNG